MSTTTSQSQPPSPRPTDRVLGAVYDTCKADIGPIVHAETDAAKMLFRGPRVPADAVRSFTRMPQVTAALAAQIDARGSNAAARADKTRGMVALKSYPSALTALGQKFADLGKALADGGSSSRPPRAILAAVIDRALRVNLLARDMHVSECAVGPTGPV